MLLVVEEHPLDVFLHTTVFCVCVKLMGMSQKIFLHLVMLIASFFIKGKLGSGASL